MIRVDLQPIADAMRECSVNVSLAFVFVALVWLIGTMWKWR